MTASRPFRVPLWEAGIPGAPVDAGAETCDAEGRTRHVSVPTLDVFLADPAIATGTAIIVCSGGGYAQLAVERHGATVFSALGHHGISVFSLKYRTAPPSTDVRRDAVADGRRTLRLIRRRATEWRVDPARVGIIGFSAGANLVANLATAPGLPDPASPDPLDQLTARPDFIGLFSLWSGRQQLSDFDFGVLPPPVWMAHTDDDQTAPIAFASGLRDGLLAKGVPVRWESFPSGGHLAFHVGSGSHGDWGDRFAAWLGERGMLR